MRLTPILAAAAITLSACAAPESGIRDLTRFRAEAEKTVVNSDRSPEDIVSCFAARSALLPGSTILPEGEATLYALRVSGYTFEEIAFRKAATGSQAEVRLAPGVNTRWRADFERDRLGPLQACAEDAS